MAKSGNKYYSCYSKISIIIITIIVADRQLGWRILHTNQIIGDDLIIWGGYSEGLP